jgi:hypothetical protein
MRRLEGVMRDRLVEGSRYNEQANREVDTETN